jgi:hypothetical protein
MDAKEQYNSIVSSLKEKTTHKLKVLNETKKQFAGLKSEAKKLSSELCGELECVENVNVKFTEKGPFQAELKFGEDVAIFFMHNDVFEFDSSHRVRKASYVSDNPMNAYCGMISVFNFLHTSFEMKRMSDTGYLIARIFINHEGQFFVEGKKQLGFLFNDFGQKVLDESTLQSIVMTIVEYCQEFDLHVPPFNSMSEVQVGQMINISNQINVKTGKRLGFRFSSEGDFEE